MSRLLDLYALLGVPLQVTLGYPAGASADPEADPELTTGAGAWKAGCTPEVQGEWAGQFAALALCKPYVQNVAWAHFTDHEPHVFPACGVIDRQGRGRASVAGGPAVAAPAAPGVNLPVVSTGVRSAEPPCYSSTMTVRNVRDTRRLR